MLPPDVASLDEAHGAIELWEHYSRKRLDPTQRLTVEMMMAQDASGRWAAPTTGRCMPRQNGKGDEIEVPELWGLVQRGEAIMHTVHDAVLLASQAQQRMLSVLEAHADLRRLVKRKWLGTGQQMIELRNGGVIWYRTRTAGGGRGVDDIARLVVDEAQHAADEHLAALTPTMLANENAQLNALGSAGIDGRSEWWWRMRVRALGDDPGKLGYLEHTAEVVYLDDDGNPVQEPIDANDRRLWLSTNPALHSERGQGLEFFEEQFRRLDAQSFAREHLGVWDSYGTAATRVIPLAAWKACEDLRSGPVGEVAFSLDVSPMRDKAAFAVAGASGRGGIHVEVVDHGDGTDWLLARALELHQRWKGPVAVATGSPAANLVPDLRTAGVPVVEVSTSEHAQACGSLFDAVIQSTLRHLGQVSLNTAVDGADKRFYGDSWLWARRKSSADITPLVACTLAMWAHEHARQPALSVW